MSELRVIKPGDRVSDVASGAMIREAAVSAGTVGAKGLWAGHVTLGPRLVSAVHHHGDAESVIYLISGRARFAWGTELRDVVDAEPGDFIWVPPHLVHVELNPSTTEPAVAVVVRSTQESIVVNLPTPPGWEPPLG